MSTDALAVVERLFRAIERGDAAAVRALYVDTTLVWHNHDGLAQTKDENLAVLDWMIANVKGIRYENVRRHAFEGGVVQQHVLRGTLPGGKTIEVPACMVIAVEKDKITRIDEYFDSQHVAPLFSA